MSAVLACGAGELAEQVGCAAARGLVEIVGHVLLGAVLWLPNAIIRPGAGWGPAHAVLLVAVATGLTARWTLMHNGPLSTELRAIPALVRPWRKRCPRTTGYIANVIRGALRLWPYGRRAVRWAGRRLLRGHPLGVVVVAAFGYAAAGLAWYIVGALPGPLPLVVAVVALHRLGGAGQSEGRDWWREAVLMPAMVEAGILRRPRDGERLRLRRLGQPVHTDRGTRIKIGLPGAVHLEDVQRGRTRLAAALGVPARDLLVSAAPDDPANVLTLFVAVRSDGSAQVAPDDAGDGIDRERWGDPLRLGENQQGTPVYWQTTATHSLVAGLTRAGKTVACQRIAARAALDPDATIFLVNGKGSAQDWDPLGPLCDLYVDRVEDDIAERVREVFERCMALTNSRNADKRHRGPHPPALLLIEEWGNVRGAISAAAGQQTLSDLDKLLVRLIAMSASAGIHIVLIQQRITKDNFPTSQSANVAQRLVLRCANRGDVAAALGEEPTEALPQQVGSGLLTNDSGRQQPVRVDGLDTDRWEALCARGAALRGIVAMPAEQPVKEAPGPATVVLTKEPGVVVVDPVHAAVISVLQDSHPAGLPAAALFDRLPAELRPASAAVLGKRLSTCGQVQQTRDSTAGRRWCLAVTVPSGDSSDSTAHAQHRPQPALPEGQGTAPSLPSLPSQTDDLPSSAAAP